MSASSALATTWYVSPEGNDGNIGSDGSHPFKTINSAEAKATSGDQIHVKQGIYSLTVYGPSNPGTITLKSGVYLRGGYDKNNWNIQTTEASTTIISGEGSVRCMYGSGLNSTTTIENFTIQNGHFYGGGGLYLVSGSCPTITNCIFTSNGYGWGGGIFNDCVYGSGNPASPIITNCTFTLNSGGGAGIYNYEFCSPTITNCTFTSNIGGTGGGGGIFNDVYSSSHILNCTFNSNSASGGNGGGGILNLINFYYGTCPTIKNCAFTSNSASYGGGIYNDCAYGSPNPTIESCTFTLNSAEVAGGGGAIANVNCTLTILNSIIYGNTGGIYLNSSSLAINYSCIEGTLYPGMGNISTDPLFVSAEAGDVHLRSTSPCIDTATSEGAPSTDIEGNPRPYGAGYDMGAYEWHAPLSTYTTKVGSAANWQWTTVTSGGTVQSGSAESWKWITWESGSPRKVPKGTAPSWTWESE